MAISITCKVCNFNPLSPCGERPDHKGFYGSRRYFNPLSPCGERRSSNRSFRGWSYFNPLSPCGERHQWYIDLQYGFPDFNPLSPCGERPPDVNAADLYLRFQSTLPMRGETKIMRANNTPYQISIHSPHAGRDTH